MPKAPCSLPRPVAWRVCAALAALFCCSLLLSPSLQAADEPLPVFVSILPQKYLLEQLGGDRVTVSVLVQPGASPHSYEPKPQQMAALSKAALYLAIGVGFEEAWLPRIRAANPDLTVVHLDEGLEKLPMLDHHHEDEHGHAHGHDHADDHGTLDPHVWLAPANMALMAQRAAEALSAAAPEQAAFFAANLAAFRDDCAALDAEIRALLAGIEPPANKFMVFHPAWGYFAKAYGLEQVPIELRGKEPSPAALQRLIQRAKKEGITVIFVQPQFSAKSAQTVAQSINGTVLPLDPLPEDWRENMLLTARAVAGAVAGQGN